MHKLGIKQQVIILSAIVIAMFALFYFFAWSPQLAKLDDLNSQQAAEQEKIEAAKVKLATLSEVKKNAANAEVELIKIQNRIPTDAQLPSLIVELQNMANDAGVDLLSIKPSEPGVGGELNVMPVSLSVTGSYVALIDFLRRIEKAPRSMSVRTIDIKASQYPDLVLNLTVETFTMGSVVAPVPSAAPIAPAPSTQANAGVNQKIDSR